MVEPVELRPKNYRPNPAYAKNLQAGCGIPVFLLHPKTRQQNHKNFSHAYLSHKNYCH